MKPFWDIYQSVQTDYQKKYSKLDKQIRILVSIFIYQLSLEHEPELFPHVFFCHEEGACSFRIGNIRILFKTEIIDLDTYKSRTIHLIDVI